MQTQSYTEYVGCAKNRNTGEYDGLFITRSTPTYALKRASEIAKNANKSGGFDYSLRDMIVKRRTTTISCTDWEILKKKS